MYKKKNAHKYIYTHDKKYLVPFPRAPGEPLTTDYITQARKSISNLDPVDGEVCVTKVYP